MVGKPEFFGLDEADHFPRKLLNKLYGEIEADGLLDHVTADWGALIENSELKAEVRRYVEPIIRERFKEVYARDIRLAQARLQRQVNERLAALPEYKRTFADRAIKKILGKYYGEPESKVESMVSVLLEAVERTDYRAIRIICTRPARPMSRLLPRACPISAWRSLRSSPSRPAAG